MMTPEQVLQEFYKGCSESGHNPTNCSVCTEAAIKALKASIAESEESHGKVIQVTEPDGEIYYLPFGEDPFDAFGTDITLQVFDLTNPQPYSEGGE